MSTRRLVVFRSSLLSGSETFIRNQTDALNRWSPISVGFERVSSPLSRATDVILYEGSTARLRTRAAKLTARSPRMTALLRRLHPDLIHAHFGFDGVAVLHAAGRVGIPLVVTFHGVDATAEADAPGPRGALYRVRLSKLFASAHRLIAVSQPIADRLIALGAQPHKIVVHHIGIPLPAGAELPRSETSGVLFVGRLTEKKGVDDLLRAYASLPDPTRDAHPLTIVGDGPLHAPLEALASSLGVKARFLGSQTPDSVRVLMRQSAVFVGPSKTASNGDAEGLGMVFLEAGALGAPVVAYAHCGVPEAVEDGVTGLLAVEGDVRQLAELMLRVLADPGLGRSLGASAQRYVAQNFDIRLQTSSLEAIYDEAVR